jgi:hypothetical protein
MNLLNILLAILFALLVGIYARKKNMDYKLWSAATLLFPYIISIVFLLVLFFAKDKEKIIAKYSFALELTVIFVYLGIMGLKEIMENTI